MRIQLAILAALLAALLAAGCGGSSSGSGGDEVVTKQSFLKEADAVCAEQQQTIQAGVQSNNSIKASEEAAEGSITALSVTAREIGALDIPSGDESEVEAMLQNVRKTLDLAGSEASNKDLSTANEYLLLAEEQADKYGLKVCFLG